MAAFSLTIELDRMTAHRKYVQYARLARARHSCDSGSRKWLCSASTFAFKRPKGTVESLQHARIKEPTALMARRPRSHSRSKHARLPWPSDFSWPSHSADAIAAIDAALVASPLQPRSRPLWPKLARSSAPRKKAKIRTSGSVDSRQRSAFCES